MRLNVFIHPFCFDRLSNKIKFTFKKKVKKLYIRDNKYDTIDKNFSTYAASIN